MLAASLNTQILCSLSEGRRQQLQLRREVGSPAQSTLRSYLTKLERIGVIERHRRSGFPGLVEYELTQSGRGLIFVVAALRRWLDEAPGRALQLGGDSGRAAVKALVDGWSSTMLRALAATPLTLTQLDSLIAPLNYPSLERRLGAMRMAGLVEVVSGNGRGNPYAVTDWLRRGIAPIVAASRWERRNLAGETAPIGRIDVEAGLMLAMPLLRLPDDVGGACRLVVELAHGERRSSATVCVTVEEGRIASCTACRQDAGAWVSGSLGAWFDAVIDADPDRLERGGDGRLAGSLLEGLHGGLFGRLGHFQNMT